MLTILQTYYLIYLSKLASLLQTNLLTSENSYICNFENLFIKKYIDKYPSVKNLKESIRNYINSFIDYPLLLCLYWKVVKDTTFPISFLIVR